MSEITAVQPEGSRHYAARYRWRMIHWAALFCLLPVSLIVALRGNTGDTENYLYVFSQSTSFPWSPIAYYSQFSMEWGFGLLSWLVNQLYLPVSVVFFVFSFGTFYFLSVAASRFGLTFFQIAPYYLSTFFLSQQFLQIRQGLAMGFVFSILSIVVTSKKKIGKPAFYAALASTIHVISVLPILTAWALSLKSLRPTRLALTLWCVFLTGSIFLMARLIMSFELFSAFSRLAEYASDGQYNLEQPLFSLPNIRAAVLMVLMLYGATSNLLQSQNFRVLLGLYAVHLGIRLGFYDFLILSARLSTALSFAEIFILPLLVREHLKNRWSRALVVLIYFVAHLFATYQIQVPSLIDDYFTPL